MFKRIFFFLFLFFIESCNHKGVAPCSPTKIDIIKVNESVNCDDFKFKLKNIDYKEIKIIDNTNDYNYYVSDNCDIDIDFDLYTVILGYFYRHKKSFSINYNMYFLPCSLSDDYHLNIKVKETAESIEQPWQHATEYLLIISKLDIETISVIYSITSNY
ncbi:MAG: hypothetical protein CSB01_01820 [Bacteroidia bacterium]|nr:MAG: hypothetical protein CSB01_01820 [Bacteroidia bacterium]